MIADRNKLNRTGRKRIGLKSFVISVLDGGKQGDKPVPTFTFSFRDEARDETLKDFPPGAVVVVEVYDGPVRELFSFGRLGAILTGAEQQGCKKPGERIPLGFSTDTNFLFNVKIVDPASKVILGSELRVKADSNAAADDRKTLLPAHLRSGMGSQLWTIEFDPTGPVLFVNRDYVSSLDDLPPLWKASVLPAAMHRILSYAFLIRNGDDCPAWAWNEDGLDWKTFVERTLKTAFPYPSHEKADADVDGYMEKVEKWIDDAVESFAAFLQSNGVPFKKLIKAQEA